MAALEWELNSSLKCLALGLMVLQANATMAQESGNAKVPTLTVRKCEDFVVNGKGDSPAWERAEWVTLNRRPEGVLDYQSRFKVLYSSSGVYVLFDAADKKLTATLQEDFLNLWTEDVFECFFWTCEDHPVYFEYEISPLGYELPILIPNLDDKFLGWTPWNYAGNRKIQKQVSATGGENKSLAAVEGWRAEVFIPYDLLRPLANVPPQSGTKWRGNFYRVDHDGGQATGWDWSRVGRSFHEYQKYGTLVFE